MVMKYLGQNHRILTLNFIDENHVVAIIEYWGEKEPPKLLAVHLNEREFRETCSFRRHHHHHHK